MKVLIAEDDAMSRKILKKTVERFGHECLEANDGQEAWELFRNCLDFDVIVSDWMMPNVDGLELCRRVRGFSSPGYTFFIFLTALGSEAQLLQGMRAGADEYLIKPLDSEQLRAKLLTASRIASTHQHLDRGSGGEGASVTRNGDTRANEKAPESPSRGKYRIAGKKVWDILVAQERVSEEQVQQALEAQKNDRRDLGQVMLSLGFISEPDLAQAQALRLNLDYIELTEADVDREALGLVPEKMLRKHRALPLYTENRQLGMAMSDPTDIYALEDLSMVSGHQIVPVMTTEESLQRSEARVFAVGQQITEILEEAAEAEAVDHSAVELGGATGADEAPVVQLVNSILQRAVGEGASDIHIEPQAQGLTVRLRVDGVLREVMSIPQGLQSGVLARLKILSSLDIAEKRVPQDGRFSVRLSEKKVDLRVASLPTVFGEEMVLRLLDTSSIDVDLSQLGFAPEILKKYEEVFRRPYGTILVTGPTGSGKSTTLYATLRELNSQEKKIITVEDPVEFRMKGVNQIQVNSKIGLTFASGLRSILRSDPDIVMIGEIRDLETAKISVEAALTGHLVLSTLHTNNAPSAVNRLTDMGVEPFLTSSAVDCVIAQRLARTLCSYCKQPTEMEKNILSNIGFPFEHAPEYGFRFHKAVGCERCGDSGYRDRVGIYELMTVTEELRELILRRASTDEISRAARDQGMIRLRDDGLLKAAQGITTVEEVLRTVV